jgi:acyl-coenzyme A thioesterase PaaI-like protein
MSREQEKSMEQVFLISLITDTIPWVKDSGLRVDVFETGHVKLSVPVARHLNHVGIVYAGTHFMLMEVAGAALFMATYGIDRFVPVNKGMSIRFVKPGLTDIACELFMSPGEAEARLAPVIERGRGDWILDMSVTDTNGTVVSTSTCNYFIIPRPA